MQPGHHDSAAKAGMPRGRFLPVRDDVSAYPRVLARSMTPGGLFGISAAIVTLTLLGLYLGLLRDGHRRAEERAEAITLGAAQAVANQVGRLTQTVEGLLVHLAAQPDGAAPPGEQALRQRIRDMPQLRAVLFLDPTFNVSRSTDPLLQGAVLRGQP